MKSFFVLLICGSIAYAGNYCVQTNITQDKILEHVLMDVQEWQDISFREKIDNTKHKIILEEVELSTRERRALPSTESGILNRRFNRPDYQNRKERETNVQP